MKNILNNWNFLEPKRRWQICGICLLIVFSSFAELISLGSVIPFLAAMGSPSRVFEYPALGSFIRFFQIETPEQLILPAAIFFGVAAIFSALVRIFLLWASTRLAFEIGADISIEMYRRTLHQPYAVHISRNSSEVISGITTKSNAIIYGYLMPSIQLVTVVVTLSVILGGLIVVDPKVALSTLFSFAAVYGVLIFSVRKRLASNGFRIARESSRVLKCLQEGLGGIRDVLLDGSQTAYCKSYQYADAQLRRAQGDNQFVSASPRYIMEAIGLSIIAALSCFLVSQPKGFVDALPLLGLLALAAQRMLPLLQQAYSAWAGIKGSHTSVRDALNLLQQQMPDLKQISLEDLTFNDRIELRSVFFSYRKDQPQILRGLDLVISKGERIGIIGSTGSGKSSLMDLIMGLLDPTEGTIEVDGKLISSNNRQAWQSHIAHVPQAIYLADSSIAENIAFGLPSHLINYSRVREAARLAQIAEMIESMPSGYESMVGERGVRLSGGQRQRIGIARALYKNADVIVLDEATSALDGETEKSVMESIEELDPELTVIVIAHRLSTLKNCGRIVELANGCIKRIGNYSDIVGVTQSVKT